MLIAKEELEAAATFNRAVSAHAEARMHYEARLEGRNCPTNTNETKAAWIRAQTARIQMDAAEYSLLEAVNWDNTRFLTTINAANLTENRLTADTSVKEALLKAQITAMIQSG